MASLRLNKILAQAGLASRRAADRLIVEGRVAVNGVVTREVGTLADPERDRIAVDGRPLPAPERTLYILLNKPRGYLTTRSDPQGRPVVTDLVPVPARLFPVGRLDADVEGVLLLTNDGAVARADLGRWRRGVMLDDGPAVPAEVELIRGGQDRSRLRLTFTEGRKHEVKRYCDALGHRVLGLRRIAFGPLALGTLRVGAWRPLTPSEVTRLRRVAALAPTHES
jgi:23S rRNA pseudouridine2605 synthase